MKVAITSTQGTLDGEVDPRFGRAAYFVAVDTVTGSVDIVDNRSSAELAHGAGIAAVEALVRLGVTVLLTGQVGPAAEQGLRAAGIEVRCCRDGRCRDALATVSEAATSSSTGTPPSAH